MGFRGIRNAPGEMPIVDRRPRDISTAVQIEHVAAWMRGRRRDPVKVEPAGFDHTGLGAARRARHPLLHAAHPVTPCRYAEISTAALHEGAQAKPHEFAAEAHPRPL